MDVRSDDPEQFRAIGWVKGKLYTVIYEVREDMAGEYCHLVTLWKTAKKKKPTADEIAEMAMSGEDISRFFTNKGDMRPPVKRVNVDFTLDMIKELDAVARALNISRQAVIKAYLRQALDQHYLAQQNIR